MNSVSTRALCQWLDTTLNAQAFSDYCPNGLQVEGKPTTSHIIAGVTASQALIDEAIARGPDPLLGNNAQLARVLGLAPDAVCTDEGSGRARAGNLIWTGAMPGAHTLGEIAAQVGTRLGREPLVIGDPAMAARRIAWCTGAAQSMLAQAIDGGAQVFITGEVSEPTVHLAREAGVGFISAGHHATERSPGNSGSGWTLSTSTTRSDRSTRDRPARGGLPRACRGC